MEVNKPAVNSWLEESSEENSDVQISDVYMPVVLDVFSILWINPRIWEAQVNKHTKEWREACHLDAVHFWHDPSVFWSSWKHVPSNNHFIMSDRVSLAVLMLDWCGLSTPWQQLRFKFLFCLLLENRWLIASAVQKHMGHSFLASFLHALSTIVTVSLSSYYRANHSLAPHPAVHSRFPAVLIFSILLGKSLQESALQCLFPNFLWF